MIEAALFLTGRVAFKTGLAVVKVTTYSFVFIVHVWLVVIVAIDASEHSIA